MKFYSNGKLLITGEYAVLDGAKALALPTKFGQNLEVTILNKPTNILFWSSFDLENKKWFHCKFDLLTFNYASESDVMIAKSLQLILKEARKLNSKFLISKKSIQVKTNLTFNKSWGLGTSSTLINNIANWAKIDAFALQFSTFGGSAYDIACAQNNLPIIYQLADKKPMVEVVHFNPVFKDQLYFVYLNKKKNSRIAIKNYRKVNNKKSQLISNISKITKQVLKTDSLLDFEKLLQEHENIIAQAIKIKPIKQQLFKDYFGAIKSLGAWGGDFILATGNNDTPTYFKEKGYKTIIPFNDMIL